MTSRDRWRPQELRSCPGASKRQDQIALSPAQLTSALVELLVLSLPRSGKSPLQGGGQSPQVPPDFTPCTVNSSCCTVSLITLQVPFILNLSIHGFVRGKTDSSITKWPPGQCACHLVPEIVPNLGPLKPILAASGLEQGALLGAARSLPRVLCFPSTQSA